MSPDPPTLPCICALCSKMARSRLDELLPAPHLTNHLHEALATPARQQERTYTLVPVAIHTLHNECRVTEANVYVRF
jgi:hypothetical protein